MREQEEELERRSAEEEAEGAPAEEEVTPERCTAFAHPLNGSHSLAPHLQHQAASDLSPTAFLPLVAALETTSSSNTLH